MGMLLARAWNMCWKTTVGARLTAVLGGLLGLCVADEPRGVKREMIHTFAHLVHGMQPAFLSQQGVIRAIAQLLHHCIRLDQTHDQVDAALLGLVCDVATQLAAQISILRLFFELGGLYAAGKDDPFPLFSYLLRHLHLPGDQGFYVRTATLQLLRTMLLSDVALRQYIIQGRFAESLSASTAAAYGLLPMHLDTVDQTFSHGLENARAAQWHSVIREWAAIDFVPEACTFLDLLWLAQEAIFLCAHSPKRGATMDQLEQLRVDILQQFRSTFLENVVHPSVAGCHVGDGSASAVLLYHALLFQVLKPTGPLSHLVCALECDRGLGSVLSECLVAYDASSTTRILALRLAGVFARRIALRDVSRGAARDTQRSPLAALAALVQSMQAPRSLPSLFGRHLQHLMEVESAMRSDPDCVFADCIARTDGIQIRLAVLREPMDAKEHFLLPLLSLLTQYFLFPLPLNAEITKTLASLCRSPYVSLQGTLSASDKRPTPLLTFALYRLVEQVHMYTTIIPDFAFYLAQHKNQQIPSGKSTAQGSTDALVCPFVTGSTTALLEEIKHTMGENWTAPETVGSLQFDSPTPLLTPLSKGNRDGVLGGAQHITMTVYPCLFPGIEPFAEKACRVPLLRVLDNALLLEEFLLELTAIGQLRQAWNWDAT